MLSRQNQVSSLSRRRAFRKWFSIVCGSGFLLIFGCNKEKKEVKVAPPPQVHVETALVKTALVPTFLPVTGTVEALLETDLAANATGKVMAISIQSGDEVKKGSFIAKLDVHLVGLQAATARAQSQVSRQQAALQAQECARLDKLAAANAIARADYEKQQWQCKVSQSSLAVSQLQASVAAQAVSDSTIRAPFDGKVVRRFIEIGEYVSPSTKVATLVSLDPLKLSISVPEAQLSYLKKDLLLTFRVASYKDRVFTAKLTRIAPIVRSTTRDVQAEAEVINTDKSLWPGMFATVDLPLDQVELPLVPQSALVKGEENTHLFVVVDKRIEERVVQLGANVSDLVAITKGLKKGEHVVIAPGPETKNGFFVK